MPAPQASTLRGAIERLLNPASLAVVGTSQSGGRGANVHRNLLRHQYPGRLYAVNPKYRDVMGTPCYPSLADLPEAVDCAVIALPADPAISVVEQCAQLGIGSAVIFASGFAEMGGRGIERQQRLNQVARSAGLAICGPNCFGLMSLAAKTIAFSGSVGSSLVAGHIALVSQSGGLSLEIATSLMARGVGLSHVISSGNEAATTLEEYLDWLVDRSEVQLLASVVEGFKNPALFLDVARRAAALEKPMVIMKLGRSEQGRRAVASHTGSLAGDDRVVDAVFDRWGVARVGTVDEMVNTITLLAERRWPGEEGVVFVSGSGGRSALLADLAAEKGVPLASFSDQASEALRALLPEFGTINNPLDLTGAMYDQEGIYTTALATVAADPAVGMVAVYQSAQRPDEGLTEERASRGAVLAAQLGAIAREASKPLVAFTTTASGSLDQQVLSVLRESGVPLLLGPDNAVSAIRHAYRYGAFRRQRQDQLAPAVSADRGAEVAALFSRLVQFGALSEHWSKRLLMLYGVPTTREALAVTVEEAERYAEGLGYPVVLKACSAKLLHKTELGLVRLGVADRDALRRSFAEVWHAAEQALQAEPAALEGVLVQELVPGGVEVIVGARQSEFGPVVLFGAGGTLAELIADTSVRLAPVSEAEARQMIAQTRVSRLLGGFRARVSLDIAALAAVISAVSRLILDGAEQIGELDINPLVVTDRGVVAVDAVITARG